MWVGVCGAMVRRCWGRCCCGDDHYRQRGDGHVAGDGGLSDGLARHLIAACFVVIAYLSGVRPGEVLSLERGCLHRDPQTGMLLITGRHWKGVRDDSGTQIPDGEIRPDPWVVAEPVAAAIEVLQQLHDEHLLFPNRLGARTQAAQRFRDGRASTTGRMSRDLDALRDWVNHYCATTGRSDTIAIDTATGEDQQSAFGGGVEPEAERSRGRPVALSMGSGHGPYRGSL
jgi:integrase